MRTPGPREIKIDRPELLTERSAEVARIWVTDGAGCTVWIDASLLQDPRTFGHLMSDTVRHAARAYAGTWSLDENEALQAIVDGLGDNLREQFNALETIREGRFN